MLSLDLDQATETLLREEAAKRGISPEQFAAMAIDILIKIGTKKTLPTDLFYLTASDQEWEDELQGWIDLQDESIPPIPDEALRRENMYEDRW